jgi:ribosomal protein L11 methyltransferase
MPWTALVIDMDRADADRLSDRLVELGADSVFAEDPAAGTPEETAVFDEPGEATEGWQRLRLRLMARDEASGRALLAQAAADVGVAVPDPIVEVVPEQDWVRASQAQFEPIAVSQRLWVVPSWHEPVDVAAINLLLDPGLAFGTGSHPTTRLCLRWLEQEVHGGESLLDYGCGSGILAIAAMKLGAAVARGVDIDPHAVEAARANAELNGVRCEFSGADAPITVQSDLVVANILANPLKVLAPAIARLTRGGGRLAIAGLLAPQADELKARYAAWFTPRNVTCEDGWARVDFVRNDCAA